MQAQLLLDRPETLDRVDHLSFHSPWESRRFHLGWKMTEHIARTVIQPLITYRIARHSSEGLAVDPRPIAAWYNMQPTGGGGYEDPLNERILYPSYRSTIFFGRWPAVEPDDDLWRSPEVYMIRHRLDGGTTTYEIALSGGIHTLSTQLGWYLFRHNGERKLIGMMLAPWAIELLVADAPC